MIYIILGFIIGIAIGIKIAIDEDEGIGYKLFIVFISQLLGVLLGLLMMLSIGSIIGHFLPTKPTIVSDMKIVAIQDSNSLSGRFFLGSGKIKNDFVYTYAVQTDKGIKIEQLTSNSDGEVYIKTTKDKPHITKYTTDFVDKSAMWYAIPLYESDYYKIYVPEGTIKYNYNIDLQ